MRFVMMAVVMAVAGFFALRQMRSASKPAAPQASPILLEPLPLISEAEQNKIIRSTNDNDPLVRWEALVLLDKMKAPKANQLLFQKLHKDIDPELRIKVINLLGQRRTPEITQNLVWVLTDQNPEIRVAALAALEKIGDYATASPITELLNDVDERVRLQALKTLNILQDKKTAEIAAEQARQNELRRQSEAAGR